MLAWSFTNLIRQSGQQRITRNFNSGRWSRGANTGVFQPWNNTGRVAGKPQSRSVRVASQSLAPSDGPALMILCLLAALVPLVFAAPLFEPYLAPKETLIQAGATTAALIWLLQKVRVDSCTVVLSPVLIPVGILVLLGAASALWSSSKSLSLEEGQRLISYILLLLVALNELKRAEARATLATALILAGAIEAVYVLLQYSFGDPIFLTAGLSGKWQTFGTLGNPNWTGEFLAVAALITFGRFTDLRKTSTQLVLSWSQRLLLVALILILLALAATLARGAWLGFLLGAAAFLMAHHSLPHARLRLKSYILPVAVTVSAAVVVTALPLLSNRAAINHLLNLKSVRGRIWMAAVTWMMIRDAPWAGHGLGTFGLQFPLYQAQAFSHSWSAPFIGNASFTSYAHNDYLQLWAELGLPALLAFGALIWIVLKRGRALAHDPVALGCWAAVISLLVNAAVAFPLHLPTTLMLFVVLVAAVEGAVSRKTMSIPKSVLTRIVVVILLLIFCVQAYRLSYQRLAAESALWRAQAALNRQSLNEAETDIRIAVQYAPNSLEGKAMLGRLHLERGEYDQALTALDQAMKLGFDVNVYELKVTALERSDRRAAAIATLNELAWLRPDLQWPRERLSYLRRANDP